MTPTASMPAPADAQVWCAIPVYNNAATILDVAARARAELANVLVIDDGSTDADLRELLKSLDVTVIRHDTNQGKGGALMTAFEYATQHGAQYLVTLDGDGQHFPEEIRHFVAQLSADTILVGRRDQVRGTMPRSSRFGRDFSDFWIHVETGSVVGDTQSGFRAYPLPAVLKLGLTCRHYNFEVEVITRALWAGLNVQSVPIGVWYAEAHERVSSFRPLVDNFRLTMLHARLTARQLLPIPHRRLPASPGVKPRDGHPWAFLMRESHATPLGLAAASGLGILLGVLLWPYGVIAMLYASLRWHLNKVMALAAVGLATLPAWQALSVRIGHAVVDKPRLQWFVGAHFVAFGASAASVILVYAVASRLHKRS